MAVSNQKQGVGSFQTDQSEFMASCLDIFAPVQVENEILSGKEILIRPINAITDEGPYEFNLISADSEYQHMPMSRIMGEIQIVKMEAGMEKDAISTDDYSTVNLIGNSLFRQMEVYLNDCQLMDLSSSLYGYKSIIETILSYGKEAKSTHLISSGYYDESGKETINVQAGGDNTSGYVRRKAHVKNSKRFSFVSQLHCDFLSCPRLLPPGCNLRLILTRQKDSFVIIANSKEYKIKIHDLQLSVRKIKVSQATASLHMNRFKSGASAIFPFHQSKLHHFTVPANVQNYSIETLVGSQLPQQIFIAFVDEESFSGKQSLNPYHFKNFNLTSFVFKVNGENCPSTPYRPDFQNDLYYREYEALMNCIGVQKENGGVDITPKNFKSGKMFIAYDSSGDMCNSFHTHALKNGNIGCEFSFKSSLSKPIKLIVFSVFHMQVTLDKDRVAKVDYIL